MPAQTVDAEAVPCEEPGPTDEIAAYRDRLAAGARLAEGSAVVGERIDAHAAGRSAEPATV